LNSEFKNEPAHFRCSELSSQPPRMIGLSEFVDLRSRNQNPIGDSPRCQPPVCDHVIHSANTNREHRGGLSATDEYLPFQWRTGSCRWLSLSILFSVLWSVAFLRVGGLLLQCLVKGAAGTRGRYAVGTLN
jgi:hypothetical protein